MKWESRFRQGAPRARMASRITGVLDTNTASALRDAYGS